ncbi:hypothetical protein ACQEVF_17710 [Nonomuraea polychroma]|uniref:hypothetical protein n=1 Tax=Nonomuraea polychroma TaxID=46176 RepID=UPI003D901052
MKITDWIPQRLRKRIRKRDASKEEKMQVTREFMIGEEWGDTYVPNEYVKLYRVAGGLAAIDYYVDTGGPSGPEFWEFAQYRSKAVWEISEMDLQARNSRYLRAASTLLNELSREESGDRNGSAPSNHDLT